MNDIDKIDARSLSRSSPASPLEESSARNIEIAISGGGVVGFFGVVQNPQVCGEYLKVLWVSVTNLLS